MKIKVILNSNVDNLGKFGDIVDVKMGYAKNYLIPNNKALFHTESQKKIFEKNKQLRLDQIKSQNENFNTISSFYKSKIILFIKNASEEGKMFGSLKSKEISDYISQDIQNNNIVKDFLLSSEMVKIPEPIKTLGVHTVKVELENQSFDILLNVCRSETEAEQNLMLHNAEKSKS